MAGPIFDNDALAKAVENVGTPPLVRPMTPPGQSSTPSWLLPALMTSGGNAADAISTWKAISSGGARETNPLLPGGGKGIMMMKAAMTLPQILAERHLANSGHPTAAKVLGGIIGGLGTGLAIHNMGLIKK